MEEERFDQRVQLVTSRKLMLAVDDWRRAQGDIPSRSEAIRRLIELGLKADPKAVTAEEVAARLIKENDPATAHLISQIAEESKD